MNKKIASWNVNSLRVRMPQLLEWLKNGQPDIVALQQINGCGLQDSFRLSKQPDERFSWWDYRANAFPRNLGLRIDLILASEALCKQAVSCHIDTSPRGLERPSDHTPVVAEFSD